MYSIVLHIINTIYLGACILIECKSGECPYIYSCEEAMESFQLELGIKQGSWPGILYIIYTNAMFLSVFLSIIFVKEIFWNIFLAILFRFISILKYISSYFL